MSKIKLSEIKIRENFLNTIPSPMIRSYMFGEFRMEKIGKNLQRIYLWEI